MPSKVKERGREEARSVDTAEQLVFGWRRQEGGPSKTRWVRPRGPRPTVCRTRSHVTAQFDSARHPPSHWGFSSHTNTYNATAKRRVLQVRVAMTAMRRQATRNRLGTLVFDVLGHVHVRLFLKGPGGAGGAGGQRWAGSPSRQKQDESQQ